MVTASCLSLTQEKRRKDFKTGQTDSLRHWSSQNVGGVLAAEKPGARIYLSWEIILGVALVNGSPVGYYCP